MKRNKKLEGVSLIVLVISIIIMIVLATAMVLTITNSGILEQANTAVNASNVSNAKEELQTKYVEWLSASNTSNTKMSKSDAQSLIDVSKYNLQGKYAVRVTTTGVPYLKGKVEPSVNWETAEYSHANMTYAGLSTGYGYNNPIIPKGFKPLETADASWEYLDFNDGLVIQDQNGNQFVWVPCELEETTSDVVNYAKYYEYEGNVDLPLTNSIDETTQIRNYGGFYIGRYEAGLPDSMSSTTQTQRDVVAVPVIKKGAIPWNYISYTNAQQSANSMYSDSVTYGVYSDVMTAKMWDTMCKWLENSGFDVYNVETWGNCANATINGIESYSVGSRIGYDYIVGVSWNNLVDEYITKTSTDYWLLKTGSSESLKAKNLYNIAGNLSEWTAEKN